MLHNYLCDFLSSKTPTSQFLLPSVVLLGVKLKHNNAHTHLSDDKMKSLDQVCACKNNNYIMTATWTTLIIGHHQTKICMNLCHIKMGAGCTSESMKYGNTKVQQAYMMNTETVSKRKSYSQ